MHLTSSVRASAGNVFRAFVDLQQWQERPVLRDWLPSPQRPIVEANGCSESGASFRHQHRSWYETGPAALRLAQEGEDCMLGCQGCMLCPAAAMHGQVLSQASQAHSKALAVPGQADILLMSSARDNLSSPSSEEAQLLTAQSLARQRCAGFQQQLTQADPASPSAILCPRQSFGKGTDPKAFSMGSMRGGSSRDRWSLPAGTPSAAGRCSIANSSCSHRIALTAALSSAILGAELALAHIDVSAYLGGHDPDDSNFPAANKAHAWI